MRYDTTQLMADVIRMAKIPAGSSYRTASTLLGIISEAMDELLVPEAIKVSGGHLMGYADTTLVEGQSRYRFPARAVRPERLMVVNSDGDSLGSLRLANGELVDEVLAGRCPPGDAVGYWCPENSHAVVVFNGSTGGTALRFYYRRQPSQLVEVGSQYAATLTSFSTVGSNYQCTVEFGASGSRTGFVAAVGAPTNSLVDVVSHLPGFESNGDDIDPSGFGASFGTTLTVLLPVASFRSPPLVGNYVTLAGYSPVPQLPPALHGALKAYATSAVLDEMGNTAGAEKWLARATLRLTSALTSVTPRSDEAETASQEIW